TFDIGDYTLNVNVIGQDVGQSEMGTYNYSVSTTVSLGVSSADFHWINSAGGGFGVASNWNPQQVPTSIDRAIFDLTAPNFVRVVAANAGIGRLLVDGMLLELNGFVQVIGGGSDNLLVRDGGQLMLDTQARLITGFSGI